MGICAFTGRCGGCTHPDTPYPRELAEKETTLRETLGDYGHLLEGIRPSPEITGYRNKMELAFGDDGGTTLTLGIRKKRSLYEVATTQDCILMPDDFKKIAAFALDFFRESGETFFHRKKHTGTLRHLVLRRGHFTGEILVMLSAASGLNADLQAFTQGLRGLYIKGSIVGILLATNDGVADAVKNENQRILWGRNFYREKLCGLMFYVSAFSFFQTNSTGAEILYGIVRDLAGGGKLAYDLYCGTGTIAQIISPQFDKVIGIEFIPEAIAAAQTNVKLNGISNCEFLTRDISRITGQKNGLHLDGDGKIDAIVVDPPRDGLAPKALTHIAELAPTRLVYIACKPASLARDLPQLAALGFTAERIIGFDLFPRTPHVEVVALLRRTDTRW
ncbi:MAG: 23S rRNA (uracil(1939)-C(5))-methyltransferase RlmD [Defluviitaleaceae bacterium]|nr:23S rRNA (uracil(1939)-C(5))-methyltransferase RlmD [Defluviitaleaceae bacterium]